MKHSMRITATEFKKQLGHWLEEAIGGSTIEIVRHGGKSAFLSNRSTNAEASPVSAPAATLLQESAHPYRTRYSLKEFRELQEKSDDRLEFIDGQPVLQASPTVLHQRILARLFAFLHRQLEGRTCEVFSAPFDVALAKSGAAEPDIVQPDLLVVCDLPPSIDPGFQYEGTPKMVVEILSSATRSRDMVSKLDLYMRSGVGEYWIVDPASESFLVYRFEDREIADVQTAKGTERFRSMALGGLEVNVSVAFRT